MKLIVFVQSLRMFVPSKSNVCEHGVTVHHKQKKKVFYERLTTNTLAYFSDEEKKV